MARSPRSSRSRRTATALAALGTAAALAGGLAPSAGAHPAAPADSSALPAGSVDSLTGSLTGGVPARDVPFYGEEYVQLTVGEPTVVEQSGEVAPSSRFELYDWSYEEWAREQGWTVSIDPRSGDVTVTAGEGARPGDEHIIRVRAVDPVGHEEAAEVRVAVAG